MGRGKGLKGWWSLVLFTDLLLIHHQVSCNEEEACAPSRCGNITNIKPPFRLRDDPANCGDRRYELACENNVTVLYLFSGRYTVLGINYNNYTIRILDGGIEEGECSSLPRCFLYLHNFSNPYFISGNGRDPYRLTDYGHEGMFPIQHIVYINCSDPVGRDDAHNYIDTAPCVNWPSKSHIYAILGDLLAGNTRDECQVKLVATITWNWESLLPNKNYSYTDVHRVLSFGFELSWWPAACALLPCPATHCLLDPDTGKPHCLASGTL